ncbi:glycoside hydrolase/deacetylase [Fomitiporia mediterranea MF3/22]|uniref:glycoside hydrolase/deacetylase n=1 Tax=Fomitiporia mediterranea (strain MF3/22) TaxID=694068 RepID=UPI000440796F|nr:glycoside hydrolase/deacetylase [Fomitiporia mediterranea MF3/22]EJD07768.1 glycoside hydrolase/deacetylase [Fomitiporia mediterranea MF3/22]
MLSHVSVILATLSAARFAVAAPTPDPEPEFELIRRQGLAAVYSSCSQPNTVALTFDDGPYIYESDIVNTLNNAGIKATFFVNGNNYDCIYDDNIYPQLQHAYDSGHLIGSHTWAHLDLSQQSWDKIHDEMWKVELAMMRILGASPAWMRPPYGNYNDQVRSASAIRNQSLVLWDFDSGDSTGSSAQQSKQAYTDLANRRPNNVLALNHETYSSTAYDVLPFAIQTLKAKGYNFATVAECLGGLPAYHSVGPRGTKDSSWTC